MDQSSTVDQLHGQVRGSVKPRILVAPLDWGLGHATRCIPIIQELIRQGCDVYLCGEGQQEALLKEEFPQLTFIPLEGYRVHYGTSALHLISNMFFQAPRLFRFIKKEHQWLNRIVEEYDLHAVISDNRFGLWHRVIPSVFITHQLQIKTNMGSWVESLVQKRNYYYINKFRECWVPDSEKGFQLAGSLSHPIKLPGTRTRYIGPLSRFKRTESTPRKDHLLVILSGPEPQRSKLENKIIAELGNYSATATVVRGLPGTVNMIPSSNMIRFYNHLPAAELQSEFESAEFIISRSGYSTVMDLVSFSKKVIFIPTPGQPEQEYLGKYLEEKKMAVCVKQQQFSLKSALQAARNFNYRFPIMENDIQLAGAVQHLLQSLAKKQGQPDSLG